MFLFQTDVSWRQRLQRLTAIDRMAIIWLLWAGAAFLPLTAKPLRRYIVLLPQLAWLATLCVVQLRQFRWPAGRRGPVTTILAACYLAALPAIYLTPPLAGLAQSSLSGVLSRVKAGQQPGLHGEVIALLMLAAVACSAVVVFVVLRRRIIWNGWRISLPFAAVAVAIATWNLGQTALTLVRPTFTLRDTSRALRDKFYDGVTVFGGVADSLALETNAFAFAYWGRQETGRILNQDPIERFQPHYITIVRQLGVPWIREQRYEEVLPGATVAETLSFLPDRKGNPRVIIDLYRAAQPLPPRAADATVTTRRSRPDRLVHRSPP